VSDEAQALYPICAHPKMVRLSVGGNMYHGCPLCGGTWPDPLPIIEKPAPGIICRYVTVDGYKRQKEAAEQALRQP